MLKKIFNRKKKASIDEFVPLFMFIFAACILIMWTINADTSISAKNDLDNIARSYMLKMESNGGLLSADKTKLIEDLKDSGFYASEDGCKTIKKADIATDYSDSNINNILAGTTLIDSGHRSTVGYGNAVNLKITVYRKVNYGIGGFGIFVNEPVKMSISLTSSSKE